ncbi:hypothetical protein BASA50_006884 [Batrachochytrium salamandrivorans]|uniref:Uncharacterized protein n=1 Tax=Batrachochytrium salamandrivorans TaxID=1357716 RepID=A0ABQ8F8T1_9FUNG|nr:hypothetical protein BASA50_006884 [Batrachochytrium salamandrivorans]
MRFVSLILLSFIATNTVAIYIPKVHPVYVRDFHLSKEGRSNRPSSCQPNPTDDNEQSGPSQRTPFTSRVLGRVTGLLTNIRDLCGRRREHSNVGDMENDQVRSSAPKEAVEYQTPESPEGEMESLTPDSPEGEMESSTPDPPEKAVESSAPDSPKEEMESPTPDSPEGKMESSIPNPPEEEMESSISDPFLLEGGIARRIKLLKEAVEKATREEEQEAKCQAKKSQTTSDESTTDSSSNSGLDESENDPELLIEIAQEASPSSQRTQTYQDYMKELRSIRLLVDEVVKGIIKIGQDNYIPGYDMMQEAAIQRSRGYLQGLADVGELMAKAWCIVPKKSTFKDRDGFLELLFRVDRFKAITNDALTWGPQRNRKGRKGLVTSKEILDDKKKKLHRITISEYGSDSDTDDNDSDDSDSDSDEEEYR